MFEKLMPRNTEIDITPMTLGDCHAASALHGQRFARGWSDGEFHALLSQKTVLGFIAHGNGLLPRRSVAGFVLAREVAGESEILSIAVDTRWAGHGLGWRLMQSAIKEIKYRGGETVFLEVDEGNAPAIALYRKLRFATVAERKGYYADRDGRKTTALVMRLDLV
ncbi:GNAT family N-acetyltransferase [Rhizobium sp. L1K21]|uniref:GNAT family N-acetyltransferase n=1 Tax=Rhizobium sp. L1K21 TaxID=2954933 RepID=UPI00209264A9|nr:N-acetyltransferase [Rhizobium sp. L1K21]MCO6187378.1 GNAT family N-acetyltransferase [Rhizobium sp. L1K21]